MKTFYNLLANTLIANVTNTFLWFALTFWIYLQTESIIAMSFLGGTFMILSSFSSLFFGNFVDHHKKKIALQLSASITLVAYAIAAIIFFSTPTDVLLNVHEPILWVFSFFILVGAVAGNMRGIALSTLVTILVEETKRDKANGLVGMVNGIAFAITSVFSGLVIGYLGMEWAIIIAVFMTFISFFHLYLLKFDKDIVNTEEGEHKRLDLKSIMQTILSIPGLMGLILFATLNNLLGGVFMALMDAYGLSIVSVQVWGIMWGVVSMGFIVGGLIAAKRGVGVKPVARLFFMNLLMWTIAIFFTIRPFILITGIGLFLYMCMIPIVEAIEQTIMQKIIPVQKQGRVFGFANSIESAASPVTAFLIGPLAQLVVIPFMEEGRGQEWFGWLLGEGAGRGISLVFVCTGIIGICVTLFAKHSQTARKLTESYHAPTPN